MSDIAIRVLNTLASTSTNWENNGLYRQALGERIPELSREDRIAQLLEQFRAGGAERVRRAFVELRTLLTATDVSALGTFEDLVKSHLFSSRTEAALRVELLDMFRSPRPLTKEELSSVLRIPSVLAPKLYPELVDAVQRFFEDRCEEAEILEAVAEIITQERSNFHSDEIVLSLERALHRPACAIALLRAALCAGSELRLGVMNVLTKIVEREGEAYNASQDSLVVSGKAPVTAALLGEMCLVGDGRMWDVLGEVLGAGADAALVIRLLKDTQGLTQF